MIPIIYLINIALTSVALHLYMLGSFIKEHTARNESYQCVTSYSLKYNLPIFEEFTFY